MDFYIAYNIALNGIFIFVFVAVGGVIFWRKSSNWFGIYVALADQIQSRMFTLEPQLATRRLLEQAVGAFGALGGEAHLGPAPQQGASFTFGEWYGQAKLTAPLVFDGAYKGSISLAARRSGLDYSARDKETLVQIAAVVAHAIEQDQPLINREQAVGRGI